ncbi:Terminase-like family protein [Anaerohalosphaera lusitana]|uniref:Terminase-like family protein n=1 Tax=Anaerohalosphaera lusitana TaxID=1936003 RepID=A0A1U9NGA3_9BACT|nr:hypothetical protein [Anaerohalosphaera lusitana]AQT66961.1 Terminase-like family protein [Anaerohalosphaera lusitana]
MGRDVEVGRANRIYEDLRMIRPAGRSDIKNYIKVFLGVDVPDVRVCGDHDTPMDYLWHCWSADKSTGKTNADAMLISADDANMASDDNAGANGDAVVWANRAGGKTHIAAIATLLDCLFKPGCDVRILGGSGEQASRMYDYLVGFLGRGFEQFVDGRILKERCQFINGSKVQVLTQSAKSVRGSHVHKLRCDEVELFDRDVFEAAKFITQSTKGIKAAMEVISTMHRPYGLMGEVVSSAKEMAVPTIKWCMWEVIERCVSRSCSTCPLWGYCGGKARHADGYLKIDDCITQMKRSSKAGFESEMLCRRPSIENVVFADFEPAVHVKPVAYDPDLPLYRTLDFGFVNPFVCLWLQTDAEGNVRVIDEYQRSRATIASHAEQLKQRTPCREEQVAATFCDPAGAGRNDVTGTSPVRELRAYGILTKYRRSGILEGVELIRRALRRGDGKSSLVIDPRCVRLIEAMQCYHYPDDVRRRGAELPDKDGVYDHHIDALRYFYVGLKHNSGAMVRKY